MKDKFLVCSNCVRWGLPWTLQHKLTVCHERKDTQGNFYHPDHIACRYFAAKRELPQDLQILRLLVQALSPSQISFLTFAAEQASKLLNIEDQEKSPLALGDLVFFTKEDVEYYGTVEGILERQICIWSPSFPAETVTLKSSETRRANRKDLEELIDKQLAHSKVEVTPEPLKEIAKLRSLKQLTEEQRQELLRQEELYAHMVTENRYLASLLAFRSKI